MSVVLYSGDNTLLVEISGLSNESTGALINNATVGCTIYVTDTGAEVSGPSWPVSLSAAGSGGNYSGTIPASDNIIAGMKFTVTIHVTSGGNVAEFSTTVYARARPI